MNGNNSYNSEILKNLIRFPFFKKELKLPKNKPTKDLNVAYLVKKEVIEKLKKLYGLKNLIDILSKNNVLSDDIDYQNCDMNYPKISEYLNRAYSKYINTIKRYESQGIISFEENEKIISFKKLMYKQSLTYLDDFEIIDQGLAIILDNKFNKSLTLIQVYYLSENNKIFLAINLNQTYFYEIVSINLNGGNIIVEYLIGVINANVINAVINSLVCDFILNLGLQKLINSNQPISIGNNICLILYPINITPNQIINQPQTKNLLNKDNNISNGNIQAMNTPKPMDRHYIILSESTPQKNINILQSYNQALSHIGAQNMKTQTQNKSKQINNNDLIISDRLKVIVLLAISQCYEYPKNKLIKIYLINPEWLEQYKYKDIKSSVSKKKMK